MRWCQQAFAGLGGRRTRKSGANSATLRLTWETHAVGDAVNDQHVEPGVEVRAFLEPVSLGVDEQRVVRVPARHHGRS